VTPLLVETRTSEVVCRREHGTCFLFWTSWVWVVVVHAPEGICVSCPRGDYDPCLQVKKFDGQPFAAKIRLWP
jgi:hypothetical protein